MSILLTITIDDAMSILSATQRSPFPNDFVASSTRQVTSTSLPAPSAVAFTRSPSAVTGLCRPGVSTNTS
jgi:hypothetical protein